MMKSERWGTQGIQDGAPLDVWTFTETEDAARQEVADLNGIAQTTQSGIVYYAVRVVGF